MKPSCRPVVLSLALLLLVPALARAEDPWVITGPVVIDAPGEVGDVVVLEGGELLVDGVGEPGLVVRGDLWAIGSGRIILRDSVVSIMSTFHGEYTVAAFGGGSVEVDGCDYRVPNSVQHGLVAFQQGRITLRDTTFDFVQLVSGDGGRTEGERLDGDFEVILMEPSSVVLRDIPRSPGGGSLWVWPTFPDGSRAEYTPPPTGFVERWDFPPPGATGIGQTVTLERCTARLWPLLVEAGSQLVLRDIPEDNWVVVGLYLPTSTHVRELLNGGPPVDRTLDIPDRTLRLENASVDTWNLYPQGHALVRVEDSVVGEILVLEEASLEMDRSTVDGSGGWFGATESGRVRARDSVFTCDIQAGGDSTMELHRCRVLPYPQDPQGVFTRIGAYERGRILLDTTVVSSNPSLGGSGLLAVSWLADPPSRPPAPGESVDLHGVAALFSADPAVAAGHWRLEAHAAWTRTPVILGSGGENVDPAGLLGTWRTADPRRDHQLRIVLTDGLGRVLSGTVEVPGTGPPQPAVRRPSSRTPAAASR